MEGLLCAPSDQGSYRTRKNKTQKRSQDARNDGFVSSITHQGHRFEGLADNHLVTASFGVWEDMHVGGGREKRRGGGEILATDLFSTTHPRVSGSLETSRKMARLCAILSSTAMRGREGLLCFLAESLARAEGFGKEARQRIPTTMLSRLVPALCWALLLAQTIHANAVVAVERTPKVSSQSFAVIHEIRNSLIRAAGEKKEWGNSTSLDKAFKDAVLFSYEEETKTEIKEEGDTSEANETVTSKAGVKVICKNCYIAGSAFAKLTIEDDGAFNLSETFTSIHDQVHSAVENVTDWVKDAARELEIPPPPDFDFDVDLPEMPGTVLEFGFEDLDLYVEIGIVFSAGLTYKLKMFQHGLGADLGEDVFLGFVFSVDLIISVEGELEISSGFHIRLDEGVKLKIAMFTDEASDMDFNGGKFEFLPVEIVSGETVIRAVLQLSLRAGFALEIDFLPGGEFEIGSFNSEDWKAAAGLETRLFANLIDFKTNFTVASTIEDDDDEEEDCPLRMQQSFQLGIGAAAGAYIGVGQNTWGPQPETEIPMFPTTFADKCISLSLPKTTSAPVLEDRQNSDDDEEMEVLTTETKVTYTGVQCAENGQINCPASLETAREFVTTMTLTTTVPSGADFEWPEETDGVVAAAAVSRVDFGEDAKDITTSSGKPDPSATKGPSGGDDDDDDESIFDKSTGGVSNKVIIGVSVGVGVPVLIAIIAAIVFMIRRKNKGAPLVASEYDRTTYVSEVVRNK